MYAVKSNIYHQWSTHNALASHNHNLGNVQHLSDHKAEAVNLFPDIMTCWTGTYLLQNKHMVLTDILTVIVGKVQVLLITLTVALFHSSVPEHHDSVTVSMQSQYQDPKTEAAKWNSTIHHHNNIYLTIAQHMLFFSQAHD